MNETLIYTDTRPRARSTGHAFGFEGNLGVPVIISGVLSVFLLTLLLNGDIGMPLFAKFLLALLPTSLTIGYIVAFRSRNRLDSIWICLLPGSMALPFSRSVSNHVIP